MTDKPTPIRGPEAEVFVPLKPGELAHLRRIIADASTAIQVTVNAFMASYELEGYTLDPQRGGFLKAAAPEPPPEP